MSNPSLMDSSRRRTGGPRQPVDAVVRLGPCELRLADRQVWLDGSRQPLAPRVFEFLALLLQRRPHVVSLGELAQTLWPDAGATDADLARTVLQARAAIGDTQWPPRWIEGVHGLGYRMVDDAVGRLLQPGPAAGPGRRMQLGLLPCRSEQGQDTPPWVTWGLPALLEQALSGLDGLDVVGADLIGRPLRAAPVREHGLQALQGFGLDRVLALEWQRRADLVVLRCRIGDAQSAGPVVEASGEEGPALVHALAEAVLRELMPGVAVAAARLSTDPFVEHAFARGVALFSAGRYRAAGLAFDLVLQARPEALRVHAWALRAAVAQGLPQAWQQGLQLLAQARAEGDRRLLAETGLLLVQAAGPAADDADRAAELAHESMGLVTDGAVRHQPWALRLRIEIAVSLASRTRGSEPRQWLQAAEHDAGQAGCPALQGLALQGLGGLDLADADPQAALDRLDQAFSLQRPVADAATLARTACLLAAARLELGGLSLACAQVDEALAWLCTLPASRRPPELLSMAALVQAERLDAPAASRVLAAFGADGDDHPAAGPHRMVARACVALGLGDGASARRLLRFALACVGAVPAAGWVDAWRGLLSRLDAVDGCADGVDLPAPLHEDRPGRPGDLAAWLRDRHARAAAAWAQGDAASALSCLEDLIGQALPGRQRSNACLDAAWLHLTAGRLEPATTLLADAGAWVESHPAGLAAQAGVLWAQRRPAEAATMQGRALQGQLGPVPPMHQALHQAYAEAAGVLPTLPTLLSDSWLPASAVR